MATEDLTGWTPPPAVATPIGDRCGRLGELGVIGLSVFRGPDGTPQLTFVYAPGRPPDADTFNGREAERVALLDLLRPHLADALPPDGTPLVIDVC